MPESFGQGADRTTDLLGDRVSDRELQVQSLLAQGPDVREEGFRGSGAVGADQDLGAVPVSVGDL
ncbi:hypothetical protein GCM10010244_55760 [Streptomyces coeruleorubidus]|nr:hypothetical protein GCM10010244_55760 [Streptomyces bellus]